MDKGFCLITLLLPGILRIVGKIPRLEKRPVNFVEVGKIIEIICRDWIGMLIGENEWDTLFLDRMQGTHHHQNLAIWYMRDAVTGMDVVHHDREGREIEGNVVAKSPTWINWHPSMMSAINQIRAADVPEIRIKTG